MKHLFTLILAIFIFFSIKGQTCHCYQDSSLNEIIDCSTIRFQNKAKLYRQFNCDSSWYTFENPRVGIKKNIYSLEQPLLGLTEKLGFQYVAEFKKTFLIQNNLISGCCTPPEYILFNKTNGTEYKNLGPLIYYSENKNSGFVVYFSDSTCNSIVIYFIDNGKKAIVQLPKNRLVISLTKTGDSYPEYLFDETFISNNYLHLQYRYQKKEKGDKWYIQKIQRSLK